MTSVSLVVFHDTTSTDGIRTASRRAVPLPVKAKALPKKARQRSAMGRKESSCVAKRAAWTMKRAGVRATTAVT